MLSCLRAVGLTALLLAAASPCAARTAGSAHIFVQSTTYSNTSLPGLYPPGTRIEFRGASSPEDAIPAFQWLFNDQPIPGATASSLVLQSATTLDSGNYRVRVTYPNAVELTNTITLNILPLPANPIDSTFTAAPFFDTDGNRLTYTSIVHVYPDGKLIAAAENKATKSIRWVRLFADGKRDGSFQFTPAHNLQRVLASLPSGGLIVTHEPYVLSANGSPWDGFILPQHFDAEAAAYTDAVVFPNGDFLISRGNDLWRFHADARVDPDFRFVATGLNAQITSVVLDRLNRIYVCTRSGFDRSVYRLLANGQTDESFGYKGSALWPLALIPLEDGRLLLQSYYEQFPTTASWQTLTDTGSVERQMGSGTIASLFDRRGSLYSRTIPHGLFERYRVEEFSVKKDISFYVGDNSLDHFQVAPDEKLFAIRRPFTADQQEIVRLHANHAVALPPTPTIASVQSPQLDASLTLTSVMAGNGNAAGPLSYQWLALDGQPLPENTTSDRLTIAQFTIEHLGRYQLRVTGPAGSVLSDVITFKDQPVFLANLSGRAFTGAGENTIIAGFVVKPRSVYSGPRLLIRAAGPALLGYGIYQPAADPAVEVFSAGGYTVRNDDWHSSSIPSAFPFTPGSKDAALETSVSGSASALLTNTGPHGIALLEVYNQETAYGSDNANAVRNLSLRAHTAPGEQTAIAGFVLVDPLGGKRSGRVLLRALGPTLRASGIALPLEDPVLTVYDSTGQIVARNDDWASGNASGDAAALSEAMKRVGAFDLAQASKDAGLLIDLPAGTYSMHATGGSGVVLLEIYLIP